MKSFQCRWCDHEEACIYDLFTHADMTHPAEFQRAVCKPEPLSEADEEEGGIP